MVQKTALNEKRGFAHRESQFSRRCTTENHRFFVSSVPISNPTKYSMYNGCSYVKNDVKVDARRHRPKIDIRHCNTSKSMRRRGMGRRSEDRVLF